MIVRFLLIQYSSHRVPTYPRMIFNVIRPSIHLLLSFLLLRLDVIMILDD